MPVRSVMSDEEDAANVWAVLMLCTRKGGTVQYVINASVRIPGHRSVGVGVGVGVVGVVVVVVVGSLELHTP